MSRFSQTDFLDFPKVYSSPHDELIATWKPPYIAKWDIGRLGIEDPNTRILREGEVISSEDEVLLEGRWASARYLAGHRAGIQWVAAYTVRRHIT